MPRSLPAAALLALAACATFPVSVTSPVSVTDAGVALELAPRPADCRVEFYRTKPPERSYDEVATLHFSGNATPAGAQDAMRAKACELGADAVIVTRDYVTTSTGGYVVGAIVVAQTEAVMTGTAVSYVDLRDRHRVDHALRESEKRADLEKALAAAAPSAVPGYVGARAKRDVVVRSAPHFTGSEVAQVPAGRVLWVSPEATAGYRSRDLGGYVDEDALELPPAAPAPAALPAAPQPGRTNI